jgi:hypothetical protein
MKTVSARQAMPRPNSRRTANDQSKVAAECPALFNFRHIEQRKPLFAGRISAIVKRHYFQ